MGGEVLAEQQGVEGLARPLRSGLTKIHVSAARNLELAVVGDGSFEFQLNTVQIDGLLSETPSNTACSITPQP